MYFGSHICCLDAFFIGEDGSGAVKKLKEAPPPPPENEKEKLLPADEDLQGQQDEKSS